MSRRRGDEGSPVPQVRGNRGSRVSSATRKDSSENSSTNWGGGQSQCQGVESARRDATGGCGSGVGAGLGVGSRPPETLAQGQGVRSYQRVTGGGCGTSGG